jgi:glucokinase
MERAGRFLGIALADITGVIDPEVYIIGGGVSRAGQFLLDIIKKNYNEKVLTICWDTEIKLAELGNDAGIYGAARLIV